MWLDQKWTTINKLRCDSYTLFFICLCMLIIVTIVITMAAGIDFYLNSFEIAYVICSQDQTHALYRWAFTALHCHHTQNSTDLLSQSWRNRRGFTLAAPGVQYGCPTWLSWSQSQYYLPNARGITAKSSLKRFALYVYAWPGVRFTFSPYYSA